MDEEVNPDHENVNSVLAQDSIELFHILSSQSHSVIMELCQMMPSEAWRQYQLDPSRSSAAARPELIKTMLDYFRSASARRCRNFLQRVCFSCENIPMLLESRIMSVAGYDSTDDVPSPAAEDVSLANTDGCERFRPAVASLEQRLVKRPRIDHWQQYISEVEKFLLKRWERLTAGLVREVQLENVWVSPRAANRSRDRPDQTPGSADRGGRTPEPDGDYGYLESRVTLETFLQGCMGKVTVLVGKTGSGKTLLTSCLGQQWASGLGPIPSSFVFVLLEFRQLNLLSHPLSLSELLFQYYLPPTGGEDAKRAIIDYLLTNPEQSCWVLDGYDEFHGKLSRQEVQRKPLHLEDPLPVADLISGLLNRQILPGSTVLVTCRVRDLIDLDGISDKVGQLLGWDQDEIKEYVDNFFGAKDVALREQAAQLLLSSRHLLAMSSIPALCNICCICLEHLLLQCRDKDTGGAPMPDEKGSKARTDAQEAEGAQMSREARGEEGNRRGDPAQRKQEDGKRKGSKDVIMDGTNGRPQLTPTSLQVPATLTQVYLTVLASFLSRAPNHGGDGEPKTKRFPHSAVTTLTILSQYQSELCELSQLAGRGLEESKILFLKEEIPQEVLKFSLKIGLLSQVELRRQDGILANAYCFIHLTVQEFLAALRIMTSNDVNDAQLKKRCTPALVELAKVSGRAQSWVQKRQDLVLTLLKSMCNSNTLTGPKILQLCHSVQESQNHQLAKQVFGVRPKLELRNIWLLPNDIEALAFVVNSADHNDIGLDFGACSMELECLIVLARCQGIHNLSFHSRKYGDKFAEKLSSVLPKFTSLRKLEFSGASLTATGAASLASGLQECPHITDINLSDNNLRDEGISRIAEIFTKLQNLSNVALGRNSTTLNAVDCLIKTMSSCLNIQHVHAEGIKDLTVTFFQKSDMNSHTSILESTISINDSCSSVEGLVVLTALLSDYPPVMELHIRLQVPVKVSIVFARGREKPASGISKSLCLSFCNLSPADLESVLRCLGTSSDLTMLDLSSNCLGNKGLKKLLDFLPRLSKIQEIKIREGSLKHEHLIRLAEIVSSCPHLAKVELNHSLLEQTEDFLQLLSFSQSGCVFRKNEFLLSLCFSLVDCAVNVHQLASIESVILSCPFLTELDFSHNSLGVEGAEFLCSVLPRLPNLTSLSMTTFLPCLRSLNLSHCVLPGGLQLIEALGQCVILEDLCLDSVALNEESRMCLARALKNINSIRRLRLNEIVTAMDNLSVLDLLAATKGHAHLEQIELGGWRMAGRGIEELNRLIPNWKELRKLKLSKNLISDQSGEKLLEALKACSHLEELGLSDNTLGKLTAARMALIFPSLTHLSVLDISLNHIDHEGSDSLSKAIMCMKNLKKINLTSVGTSELCPVVASLAHCPLIQEVGLWKNKIFEGDVQRLGLRDRRMNFSST
ncbi:NLR family, CARD domain containing 5 [Neolamprologus brichardi]|uniref:NLR family, CARD domain containing 5 n=1 Tax=Neolamprologus brichardi TaxID=32507 RepID=UPI001643B091|nr:NLR family, CARD domain containing 5 [Neolamprologus brichardi]